MLSRRVVVAANLKPAKMRDVMSAGMVRVVWFGVESGARVRCGSTCYSVLLIGAREWAARSGARVDDAHL